MYFWEAEIARGKFQKLATIGYLVADNIHPLLGGEFKGPVNNRLV